MTVADSTSENVRTAKGTDSPANEVEARAVVRWLADHRKTLAESEDMDGITVGTVHAMQGDQRPVALVSLTYGANAKRTAFVGGHPFDVLRRHAAPSGGLLW